MTTRHTTRLRVLSYLKRQGKRGATDEQIQSALEMNGNTERPRRRELEESGKVRDSGQRRKTQAGWPAIVWVAA